MMAGSVEPSVFEKPEEQKVAQIAYDVIRKLENQPRKVPSVAFLQNEEIQKEVIAEVEKQYRPLQSELEGIAEKPDIADGRDENGGAGR